MKKCLLLLSLTSTLMSFSQNEFQIISTGTKYNVTQLESALQNAELCNFFYEGENRILLFDDGSKVSLAKQLDLPTHNSDCFITKSPSHLNEYWEISENGHLIRRIQTVGK